MPVTLSVRFTGGRYHATPWGRHVNEGAVEWPPSPWRILRALLAVGFAKRHWPGDCKEIPAAARSLIEKFAASPPQYRLPEGGVSHTRHFMPIQEGRNQKTTKVLDAFVRLAGDAPLLVRWEVQLNDAEEKEFQGLVSGLSYLGRAESWVSATAEAQPTEPDEQWCRPFVPGTPVPQGWEQIPLLAPVTVTDYAGWRAAAVAREQLDAPAGPGRRTKRGAEAHPADLVACLCMETATLQAQGWSQPPGSQQVLYLRRADALEPSVARPRAPRRVIEPVESALLAFASDTERGTLLPLCIRSLPHMETLHDALIRLAHPDVPASLTGRDPDSGVPLRGHRHARYIPLDMDRDRRIDHVLVYAPMGLDHRAQAALQRLTKTWGKNLPEIVVSLAGLGSLGLFRSQLRNRAGGALPELSKSCVWESLTPFVAPRFPHPRGRNSIEDQVAAECVSHGFPAPAGVEVLSRAELVNRSFLRFIRARREGHPQPPTSVPWCLRLSFSAPVEGPLALGYGSHFGLGLFEARGHE